MQSRLTAGAVLFAALATALASHAQTNVYRWTDAQGKIHYSDQPPPEDAKSVSQRLMGGGYQQQPELPYATQLAMKRNPVTLFTAKNCGRPCDRGRDLLSNRGVPYSERDASASNADMEALRKVAGSLDVPVLVVGDGKVKGYEEDAWNGALDAAGYPRTRLPGQPATVGTPQAAPAAPQAAPGAGSAPPGSAAR